MMDHRSTQAFREDLEEETDLPIAQVDSPDIVDRTGTWPIDRIWESEPMIITSPSQRMELARSIIRQNTPTPRNMGMGRPGRMESSPPLFNL